LEEEKGETREKISEKEKFWEGKKEFLVELGNLEEKKRKGGKKIEVKKK